MIAQIWNLRFHIFRAESMKVKGEETIEDFLSAKEGSNEQN
jgi:hypothetical protein